MIKSVYDIPCHGCTEHSAHCHAECPRYKEWYILNEEKKAAEKRDHDNRYAIISPAYESMQKNALRRKRQGRK